MNDAAACRSDPHGSAAGPTRSRRPLAIREIELAPPGPGELLVRVGAAGLCHSDLSVIDGTRPRPMPMVLGHEAAGVVEHCDPAGGFAPGDHVVFAFVPSCGACLPCAEGRPALCEPGAAANTAGVLLGGGRRWCDSADGPVSHHLGISGFAERIVVSARSAVRIDPDLPMDIAALFGCAVMTGVGAVVNTARVPPGASVAVFGLGGVGLACVLGAVACGANPVVVVDPSAEKRALALELGASHAFAAGEGAVDGIRQATGGGAAYVFESVGHEAVLAQAYAATRRGGTTIATGLPHPTPAVQRAGGQPGGRGTHGARQLHGLRRAYAGPAALHRDVSGGTSCRWTAC